MKTISVLFLGLVLVLGIQPTGWAQTYYDTASVRKIGWLVSIPAQFPDLDRLNEELRSANQATLPPAIVGITLGFTNRHRDYNSYGLTQLTLLSGLDENGNSSQDTRFWMGKLSFSGQYDLVANPKWLGYPYLRLGFSFGQLTVVSADTSVTFQTSLRFLGSPDYALKKYTTGVILNGDLGLGVERQFSFPGTTGFVGMSAGYELSTRTEWQLHDTYYTPWGSPPFRTNGWVVELRLRLEYNPKTAPQEPSEPQGLFRLFK